MRAVVYRGPNRVAVQDVDRPRIESPADAVVRITSTAICGSDLRMHEGRIGARAGLIFGREAPGVVEEADDAAISIAAAAPSAALGP